MCGEEQQRHAPTLFGSGSPPHVRGRVRTRPKWGWEGGITPACAGKSSALAAGQDSA